MTTKEEEVAEEAITNNLKKVLIAEEEERSEEPGKKPVEKRERRFWNDLPYEERYEIVKEENSRKKVLETGVKGRVKWFSIFNNYGFIQRNDEKPDVYVHQTSITKSVIEKFYFRSLKSDEEVEFDIVEGWKGPEAGNVTGPGGEKVIGVGRRYIGANRRRFRKNKERAGSEEGSPPTTVNGGPRRREGRKSENEKVKEEDVKVAEAGNSAKPPASGGRRRYRTRNIRRSHKIEQFQSESGDSKLAEGSQEHRRRNLSGVVSRSPEPEPDDEPAPTIASERASATGDAAELNAQTIETAQI